MSPIQIVDRFQFCGNTFAKIKKQSDPRIIDDKRSVAYTIYNAFLQSKVRKIRHLPYTSEAEAAESVMSKSRADLHNLFASSVNSIYTADIPTSIICI